MENKTLRWLLFISLSLIWGSSFILMKAGMNGLTSLQVASLRIVAAGLVLLPLAWSGLRQLPWKSLPYIFLSGTLGSLLPAYLFCIAEEIIDSSLAGMLNSLTPIFVILTGVLFFNTRTNQKKIMGVLIAFGGCLLIFFSKEGMMQGTQLLYVSMIILATISYGFNVNLVHRYLSGIPSLRIVSVALVLNSVPAWVVLVATGYFQKDLSQTHILAATGYSFLLGVVGTSLANYLFYMLIKRAGTIFSSMVTYGIPFVAISWGIIFGEEMNTLKFLGLAVILGGVYLANSPQRPKS
jgi:drug/metabolite transporter (DMT)-like permease